MSLPMFIGISPLSILHPLSLLGCHDLLLGGRGLWGGGVFQALAFPVYVFVGTARTVDRTVKTNLVFSPKP